MKRTTIITLSLVALFATTSCGSKSRSHTNHVEDIEEDEWYYDGDSYGGDEVYICTGGISKRYHFDEYCRGLERCKGEIKMVDVEFAEEKGRTPCRICCDDYDE